MVERALERIEKECGQKVCKLFEPAVRLLYQLTHKLPASENHHSSQEGGLFWHSVETAIACFLKAKEKIDSVVSYGQNNTINSIETAVLREQYLLASFLTGLVHDVGKIADYEPVPDRKGWTVPYFPLELKTPSVPMRRVRWRRDMSHNMLSALLLYEFLKTNPSLLRWDKEVYINMVSALAFEHTPLAQAFAQDNFLLSVLREGDMAVVSKELKREGQEKEESYFALLQDRIMKDKAVNLSNFFRVIVDKEQGVVVINASMAVEEMAERLKLPKQAILSILSEHKLTSQEIVRVRVGDKVLPAVVLPLQAFNFPEDYLNALPKVKWEVLEQVGEVKSERAKEVKEVEL